MLNSVLYKKWYGSSTCNAMVQFFPQKTIVIFLIPPSSFFQLTYSQYFFLKKNDEAFNPSCVSILELSIIHTLSHCKLGALVSIATLLGRFYFCSLAFSLFTSLGCLLDTALGIDGEFTTLTSSLYLLTINGWLPTSTSSINFWLIDVLNTEGH